MVSTRGQIAALTTVVLLTPQIALSIPIYGQCGGIGWTGGTTCDSGNTCTKLNDYYYQCLPGSGSGTTTTKPPISPTTTSSNSTPTSPPSSGSGLDARMKAKGRKYFGTCADPNTLGVSQIVSIIKSDFGCLTPENSAKWQSTEPTQGKFNFGGFDTLVNFAQSNGKLVRGHTFVWHGQLPSWVSSISNSGTLTSVMQNHIQTLGSRYAGKIYAWDVVNEIFNDNGTFRSSVFYNVLGSNFVSVAFKAARAADPSAKLYINDYNLDNMGWAAPKVNGVANLVKSQRAAGVPIDGIGSQSHLGAGGAGGVQAALQTLVASGVPEVALTELDIVNAAASDYTTVVKACLSVSNCIGITTWGVSDNYSWVSSSNPLLFNSSYQKKAAYNAVISALS
ncbi:endo-beta-1,4-xylanase [Ceratobasidium sp. AG-Ba]|nr:endo-beta-1,4-xylanase [Ceratobasidium sp. AG-Ba]